MSELFQMAQTPNKVKKIVILFQILGQLLGQKLVGQVAEVLVRVHLGFLILLGCKASCSR
jgi:hypothetical protein